MEQVGRKVGLDSIGEMSLLVIALNYIKSNALSPMP